jgi:hypothetical protein
MDIKKPDLKVLLEKLSALRNYMNLVVPLIVAIVAGLMFIPTALLNAGLREKIKTQSLAQGSSLDRMAEAPVSKDQIQVEREYLKVYADDANQIEQMALQSTQRELLSYRIFPLPKDASVLIFEEFGKRYRAGIEQMITQLRGRDAPAEAELAEHLQSVQGRMGAGDMRMGVGMMSYGTRTPVPRGAGRTPTTGGAGDYGMGVNPVIEQIVEAVCLERAQSCGLYVAPTDVAGYNFWTGYRYDAGTEQAVTDCWYWQLGYWIIQDVFDTIHVCNAATKNVLDSPVKRLIKVGFTRSMTGLDRGGVYGRAMVGMSVDGTQPEPSPQYVMTTATGLTPSCTGRFTQGDIHVVHFEITAVVRAGDVMDFMKALCSAKEHRFAGFDGQQPPQSFKHNQITVLENSVRAIDRSGSGTAGMGMAQYGVAMGTMDRGQGMGTGTTSHQLYRYGQDAVVELNLICEYLFEKAGYEAVLPDAVKKVLTPEAETNPG